MMIQLLKCRSTRSDHAAKSLAVGSLVIFFIHCIRLFYGILNNWLGSQMNGNGFARGAGEARHELTMIGKSGLHRREFVRPFLQSPFRRLYKCGNDDR